MTKLIKLKVKKNAAYVYFFLTAEAASISGLRLRNVDRFTEYGDRVLPLGASYEGLPRSSFNNGTCERASVGLCSAGRLSMPSSSPS